MSIKYGATVCLAMAALAWLGMVGAAPQAWAAEAPDGAASEAQPAAAKASFACEGNLLLDPSFEAGSTDNPNWEASAAGAASPLCNIDCGGTLHARTGDWWLGFGGNADADTDAAVWQAVTLPKSEAATLTFYLAMPAVTAGSYVRVSVDNALVFQATDAEAASYAAYKRASVDVKAFADGAAHTLRFEGHTTAGGPADIFVDDVCLNTLPDETKAAPPVPLLGVVDAYSSSAIHIAWEDVAGETAYELERSMVETGGFVRIATLPVDTISYEDTGLSSAQQYCYRLRALNGAEASAYSVVRCTHTYCILTVQISPGSGTSSVAGTNINCPLENCVAEYPYNTTISLNAIPDAVHTFDHWTGITGDTSNPSTSLIMNQNRTVMATFAPIAPNRPSALRVRPVPSASPGITPPSSVLEISWSDNSTNEARFELQVAPASGGPWEDVPISLPADTTSTEHNELSSATEYFYRVRACNDTGCSDWSTVASAFTFGILTVTKTYIGGAGDGTVTGTGGPGTPGGSGINCGTDCVEEYSINDLYNYSSDVLLEAVPDSQSVFVRWEGLTNPKDEFDPENRTNCTVYMSGNRFITAIFTNNLCSAATLTFTVSGDFVIPPLIDLCPYVSPPPDFDPTQIQWFITAPDPEATDGIYTFPTQFSVPWVANPLIPTAGECTTVGCSEYPYMQQPGKYIIGMRVTFTSRLDGSSFVCPPEDRPPYIPPDPANTAQPLSPEIKQNAANFDAEGLICDTDSQGLVPMNDWVPLFWFDMSYGDDRAPRVLTYLEYSIHSDFAPSRPYVRSGDSPVEDDIYEFGLFVDSGPKSEPDKTLIADDDGRLVYSSSVGGFFLDNGSFFNTHDYKPLLTWDNHGFPYEMPDAGGHYSINDGHYRLSFTFDPRPLPIGTDPNSIGPENFYPYQINGFHCQDPFSLDNPKFPFLKTTTNYPGAPLLFAYPGIDPQSVMLNWVTAAHEPHRGFIVAMRLSSLWRSGKTFGVDVTDARMQPWNGPSPTSTLIGMDSLYPHELYCVTNFPVNDSGEPVDSYSPNFYGSPREIVTDECGYSAAFDVFDITGDTIYDYEPGRYHNLWDWQVRMYTPVSEHVRPRWDVSDTFLQGVTGEWVDLRRLFSVDAWVPLIGIDIHGSCVGDQISEVNLVLTDVGADPYGPQGNGGFNPNDALEVMTTSSTGTIDTTVQSDYAFNGAWLWYDTAGGNACGFPNANCGANGVFDPPTPLDPSGASFGIKFNDYPMYPDFFDNQGGFVNPGLNQWEYIPFPPGGGDPWWRIKMRFSGGRRRPPDATCTGYFEGTPEAIPDPPFWWSVADYFVVVHTDSGFQDVSGMAGDGTGMRLGADFRAFIEPRRWSPRGTDARLCGHWEGGILTTNMFVETKRQPDGHFSPYTQDSPGLDTAGVGSVIPAQPWWTERVNSRDNSKIMRSGMDVHDLVLTYSTGNAYGKETYILPSQYPIPNMERSLAGWRGMLVEKYGLIIDNAYWQSGGLTLLSLWMDPPRMVFEESFDIFGIMGYRFRNLFAPGIMPDASEGIFTTQNNQDQFTSIQYSFETVPFDLRSEDTTVGWPEGPALNDPRSTFYPRPEPQPTLPKYETWPPADITPAGFPFITTPLLDYSIAHGLYSIAYLDQGSVSNNEPFFSPTSPSTEATYADDIVYFDASDCAICDVDLLADGPLWLLDSNGGKFRVLAQNGTVFTLENGRAAYMGKYYDSPVALLDRDCNPVLHLITGLPVITSEVTFSDYPYDPCQRAGIQYAIQRGAWLLARDVLKPGRYPSQGDWPAGLSEREFPAVSPHGERAARLLKQHVEYNSMPTAMLGINVAGSDDPVVNRFAPTTLNRISLAFWGPEFVNTDLAKLDSKTGNLFSSGVMLYEDSNGTGAFDGPVMADFSPLPAFFDQIVPLEPSSLKWPTAPEPIDLDGDNVPDDLSGDGIIVLSQSEAASQSGNPQYDGFLDLAWVLQIEPQQPWVLPDADTRAGTPHPADVPWDKSLAPVVPGAVEDAVTAGWPAYWRKKPQTFDVSKIGASGDAKALARGGHLGDDLFVAVRTSEEIHQFEQFRCFVPARLPSRTPLSATYAGIDITRGLTSIGSTNSGPFEKKSPEEGAVQDFYAHDMLEVNVPARVIDLSDTLKPTGVVNPRPVVLPGGPPVALLGIDCSANRADNLIASGTQSETSGLDFTPANVDVPDDSIYFGASGWTNETVGLWIIGMSAEEGENSRLSAYQITAVSGETLTLRGGAPRNGGEWFLVKDPTFLEQVIVEFYDQSAHGQGRHFNPYNDLRALDIEDPVNGRTSGVSLYRDNDLDPRNRNGVFDPPILNASNQLEYIDLPVRLDDPPVYIGLQGEPEFQVKMVFSSPGTDNSTGRAAMPYATQPNLRQWIPQTFGATMDDENYGSDFFVVIRPSPDMVVGDAFRAAIVSWGPNTPSEPDPDNFSEILGTSQHEDEFDKFSEFAHGARGLGFITFFKDPPPVYYWTYDRARDRVVPTQEVDHSQDDKEIKYWIRTNPNQAARTQVIYSLPQSKVDFTADRHRQVPGGDVNFTLIATGSVSSVKWDFGDGTTSTERNPKHQYSQTGKYTVTVTVTDQYGIEVSETKVDFIEILEPPFVDFIASPTEGAITPDLIGGRVPGLDVTFTDLSVGTDTMLPKAWFWNFGDGTTPAEQTQQNPVHRYTREGFFTVTLEVTFIDSTTSETQVENYRIPDYITVRPCVAGCGSTGEGEGEGEAESPADFKVDGTIRDKESLVPLTDWVPLFHFTMGYPADTPAPRVLSRLIYNLRPDKRKPEDLNYANLGGPMTSDILEFGLFQETDGGDKGDLVLDEDYDYLLYVWDSLGQTSNGVIATVEEVPGVQLLYTMDFIGTGTPQEPQFPVFAEANADNGLNGASFHIAVRTSATYRSQTTMGCDVLAAQMVKFDTGAFPVDNDAKPVDTYEPNFYDAGKLEPEASYSASFTCWDVTGSPTGVQAPGFMDAWNYPGYLYTPADEFTRPRWNKFNQFIDIMSGEFVEMKNLLPVDTWVSAIGINAQSTKALHFDANESNGMFRDISSKDAAQLREVNVALTDIGADPYGSPGNGGFNPNDGLARNTTGLWGAPIREDEAFADDITYNGIWVWHDTNNNGVFDAPTPQPGGGIVFNGDYPLLPEYTVSTSGSLDIFTGPANTWEYVAFPPGGGDPWWVTTLRFYGGRRRSSDKLIDKANVEGYLEKTPDNLIGAFSGGEYTNDYFVVVRTSSGFQDVSLGPATNVGLTLGADFRAFIEPRRVDSNGHARGGIYLDSMIPTQFMSATNSSQIVTWQHDPRWGIEEPWWPERTVSAASTKPLRYSVEVHDLVLTYSSDSTFAHQTDLFFGDGTASSGECFGYALQGTDPTDFGLWTDPFGVAQGKFLNSHSPGVTRWRLFGHTEFPFGGGATGEDPLSLSYDDTTSRGQFAYETVPFYHFEDPGTDVPPGGPRAAAFSAPPFQPTLPEYANWTATVKPGGYPHASDWAPENAQARLLTQKTDIDSTQVAMLGFNLIGSADPFVNQRNETSVASITVAFWGPDFTPSDLASLDPLGQDLDSGVMLFEDTDGTGMFLISKPFESYMHFPLPIPGLDEPVPLRDLSWPSKPEFVDLNGDGAPDDMDGNGLVDDTDKAWVLTIVPQNLWNVPHQDGITIQFNGAILECGSIDFSGLKSGRSAGPNHALETGTGAKALDPTQNQPGDDLFITVKPSASLRRFEQFRAVVPATLPERPEGQRKGGIQLYPQVNTSVTAAVKNNPDEDPVQDFYCHDMLEVNVPVRLLDMANQSQLITIGGAAVPTLGLDISTNREDAGTLASGTAGVGADGTFAVSGANWAPGAFAGDWLLDSGYETFEIVGNTANQLTLLSGQPKNGRWRIVTEPTFLEQVVVEFYNEGLDEDFNPVNDLLPLNIDQRLSGLALYRDNDADPGNRNGLFDAGIDIPLLLDAAPVYSGLTGENIQVKFVFSTPGTDNVPAAKAEQSRHRQWVPDTFGDRTPNEFSGADFLVVVRASDRMEVNTNFRLGIVSWGPNTPTEPDPDTWAILSGEERNGYSKFEEFSWGSRGLGFITFLKNPRIEYTLEGTTAKQRPDGSGFNWVRTHTSKKRRSGVITAQAKPISPFSVVLESASVSQLPSQTLPGEPFTLVLRGTGFGTRPTVVIGGYDVTVASATNTDISLSIGTQAGVVPQEPIIVIVRNPDTSQEASRADLFTLKPGGENAPEINSVSPPKGDKNVFPVVVNGKNFAGRGSVEVLFGRTLMPVVDVSADGTKITVGFPAGGLPGTGAMDVKVSNVNKGTEATLVDGFEYVNKAQSRTGCAAGGADSGGGSPAGDVLLMILVAAGLGWTVFPRRRGMVE